MALRNTLWITALALGGVVVPASASGGSTPSTPTPPTVTRTFVFPPFGLANSSTSVENARISVLNIAQTAHNGTKASCTGSISFANGTGTAVGKPVTFTNLPTGEIASGDVIGLSPGSSSIRNEFQGSVQVTMPLTSAAPCSLLLTLEVYDAQSGATHALVTTSVEEPLAIEPATGHNQ